MTRPTSRLEPDYRRRERRERAATAASEGAGRLVGVRQRLQAGRTPRLPARAPALRLRGVDSALDRCACTSSCRAASTTRSRSPTGSRDSVPVILNLQSADSELSGG